MTLFEKLNLLWKFLFLAVFTYGVFALTCCASQSGCSDQSSCSKPCQLDQTPKKPCQLDQAPKAQCGAGCTKSCCSNN